MTLVGGNDYKRKKKGATTKEGKKREEKPGLFLSRVRVKRVQRGKQKEKKRESCIYGGGRKGGGRGSILRLPSGGRVKE